MMSKSTPEQISLYFRALSQTTRLEIVLAIGCAEACVCHLEAATGHRQAYISQQLMALRQAGIVNSRREGRNIYYRLRDPAGIDLIRQAGLLIGIKADELPVGGSGAPLTECPCPQCTVGEMREPSQSSFKPG
jgi:ArsR family transcriptional regulator